MPGDKEVPGPIQPLRGNLGELFRLKQQYRHLKVLLSVGGWDFSPNLAASIATPENRKNFALSAVQIIKDYGFDGIDVDWEYADTNDRSFQLVELLKVLRQELDNYARTIKLDPKFLEISVAGPAGPYQYQFLQFALMDPYITFWNLMGYDYSGPWSSSSEYHSNLYQGKLSTSEAVKYYLAHGVTARKLVLGMPLYGRAFDNTDGVGTPYQGNGVGTWDGFTYDYKSINYTGEQTDMTAMAVWNYDPIKRQFITYDNNIVATAKADYVVKNGLGGGMWWEISADYPITHERSLVRAFTDKIGMHRFQNNRNLLYYPTSPFPNLRNITTNVGF